MDLQSWHTKSVTDIQKNPFFPFLFASASLDGTVIVWLLGPGQNPHLEKFELSHLGEQAAIDRYVSGVSGSEMKGLKMRQLLAIQGTHFPECADQLSEQASSANSVAWLSRTKLAVAQSNGKVSLVDVTERDADRVIAYFKYDSIWSVKVVTEKTIAVASEAGVHLLTAPDAQGAGAMEPGSSSSHYWHS